MADPKIVREWLDKADEDSNFARINLEERDNFYPQICFHFHQAAEKYLKSFIVAHDLQFEKTHNLMSVSDLSSLKPYALCLPPNA